MSTMMTGPPVTLDGPVPVAPPHGLLTIPGVLQPDNDEHWLNGGSVYPYPADLPQLWDPCSAGTMRTKGDGTSIEPPMFGTGVAYLPISCSALGVGDPDEFARRAEVVLEATESYAVEKALSQGLPPPSANPFFTDGNMTLLASGVSSTVGLAYLEEAVGRNSGRAAIIHATPGVGSQWGFDQLQEIDGTLYTANGNPVALGPGYTGANGQTYASHQSLAFATGWVHVRREPMDVLEIRDTLDRSNNDVTFRAERFILATWDTAVQLGVLIDWTL